MYFSFDKLSRGSILGSCNALFLLPPYVKHLAIPIAPMASRRSASCTIANSRVSSTIDLLETSFLNPIPLIIATISSFWPCSNPISSRNIWTTLISSILSLVYL
uniref:Metal-dependent phosphohydrolase, HD subdomain n=1 Tax=Arundo donax TaxID=35708 RepID=A0A0A9DUZ3_ARUDO